MGRRSGCPPAPHALFRSVAQMGGWVGVVAQEGRVHAPREEAAKSGVLGPVSGCCIFSLQGLLGGLGSGPEG